MRSRDSLLGRLTQSSRDLHFERPLCGHGNNYYRYKAEAAVRATLMRVMQTEALQHRLCSSIMRQYDGGSLELLESGLNLPELDNCSCDIAL